MVGLLLATLLLVAGGLLTWGGTFANDAVKSQLAAQKIEIPASNGDSKATTDVTAFFKANGGKIMTTGKQAQMYADHYIGFHLSAMPTYAATSNAARAALGALAADATNADLQAKATAATKLVDTVFKGQSLRGMLLNAYAFWQLGQIALISSYAAFAGALIFLILALMGFAHLRRTDEEAAI